MEVDTADSDFSTNEEVEELGWDIWNKLVRVNLCTSGSNLGATKTRKEVSNTNKEDRVIHYQTPKKICDYGQNFEQ